MFERKIPGKIFLAALAIRWAYALVLYAAMGNHGILGQDSQGYLGWSEDYVAKLMAGAIHGWDWLGLEPSLMPLGPWLWNICVILFGPWAALAVVLIQGIIDAATCVLIYALAQKISPRAAVYAGIAACINPSQIVMSGLLYTDTPFLFFVALTLLWSVTWLQTPSWRAALLIGLGLAGAALSRILIVPWGAGALVFLLVVAAVQGRYSARAFRQLAAAGLMLAVAIAPVVARNVVHYGSWALTPQTGAYYALWIVPLVRQANDGTPWATGAAQMQERIAKEIPAGVTNPFESSRLYEQVAKRALDELGFAAIAKAWVYGAAINLGAPALTLSPPVMQLPRTGFYGTPGVSMPDKIFNFLFRSDNALYAWLLLVGVAGVLMMRAIQAIGLAVIVRDRSQWPAVLLLGSWVGFILAINGPIASPKYRLPLEPPFMVLAGVGVARLADWRRARGAAA